MMFYYLFLNLKNFNPHRSIEKAIKKIRKSFSTSSMNSEALFQQQNLCFYVFKNYKVNKNANSRSNCRYSK